MWCSLRVFAVTAALAMFFSACTVSPTLGWTYVPDETSIWGLTVANTEDGGFIIGGGYNSQYSMYALKLNATGLRDWDMAYSNLSAQGSHSELWRDEARGIRQTADGGYIMAGSGKHDSDPADQPDKSFLLVKTGTTGDVAWSRAYAPLNPYSPGKACINNMPYALDITSDGGYFVAGSSYVGGYHLASVLKTDAAGNVEFLKVINDNAKAYDQIVTDARQTSDGGYIVCGYSENGSPHGHLALLIKLDAAGETVFSSTYQYAPGGYGAIASAVTPTLDGGYVLCGDLINNITKVLNHGPWMAKLNADGDEVLWEQAFGEAEAIYNTRTIEETPQVDLLAGGKNAVGAMALAKFTGNGGLLWTYSLPDTFPDATVNDLALTEDGGCVLVGSSVTATTVVAKIVNVFPVE